MILNRPIRKQKRRGVVVVLVGIVMIPLAAMVAFAVDYGYLLKIRTDLQRGADAAALAAVQDLVPEADGTQDLAAVRATIRAYAAENIDRSFQVLDSDIHIGRYDPSTIYSNVTLLNTGVLDTVQVTLRRDGQINSNVALFFAPVMGIHDSAVTATATAVLQKAAILRPGSGVLPFSIPENVWNSRGPGDPWTVYGDGKLADSLGADIPGNWGTLDIGSTANSTSDINGQILNGLDQSHLNALHQDSRIPTNTHIDSRQSCWLNGDTGLSVGIKQSVQAVHGMTRIVPIYDSLAGAPLAGGGVEFHIVGWGVVTVVDSNWAGTKNTFVRIKKSYTFDGLLRLQSDLSNTSVVIDGAFTSPALVD